MTSAQRGPRQAPSGSPRRKSARTRNDPFVGCLINGRYRMLGRLAVTAMSRVYQGRDEDTGQRVAIKVLVVRDARPEMAPVYRERFMREADALARLSHRNIVRVLDHGVEGQLPYLVMEFLEGGTLRTLLRSFTPTPSATLRMVEHLTHALEAAHSAGIVHRDIKPSNLFVTGAIEGTGPLSVRVIDFGIAKDLQDRSDLTGQGSVLGTPWYMAPEQTLGDAIDGRTDIYALGCLLFRLLMGRTPFGDRRGTSVLVAHVATPPPTFHAVKPLHGLPSVIEWTVQRCLEKDADDRFANMEELRNAIQVCRLALEDPALDPALQLANGRVVASQALLDHLDPDESVTAQLPQTSPVMVLLDPLRLSMLVCFLGAAAMLGGAMAWAVWMSLL